MIFFKLNTDAAKQQKSSGMQEEKPKSGNQSFSKENKVFFKDLQ